MADSKHVVADPSVKEEINAIAEHLEVMENDFRYDPLYGVAMLKVSFNLRPQKWAGFDEILDKTLSDLSVDRKELDKYLDKNKKSLEMACKIVGI